MNDRGFTLIELMVVVAIIAILASTAVPVYQGYITSAASAEAAATLADISAKEEAYRGAWGNYILTNDGYVNNRPLSDKSVQTMAANNSGWTRLGYAQHTDEQGGLFGGPVYYRYEVISSANNNPGIAAFADNYTVCAQRRVDDTHYETVKMSNFNRRSLITQPVQNCTAINPAAN
ncbi:MAG: prepilin-type N-terminal cleavage/methylation domain-containing protein [Proteobacteria bacterium]|nr:prepilin-type N-terminal cleavage/methylation domain-containing protein [Pseudomonadota bacterium]